MPQAAEQAKADVGPGGRSGRIAFWESKAGWLLLAAIAIVFLAVFADVIFGNRSLVGGDVRYLYLPWRASADSHAPTNVDSFDLAFEFEPWLNATRDALLAGRFPLWDPDGRFGFPLLANDQSALLSPLTWLVVPLGVERGITFAMLLKPWVGGLGAALFLRALGARSLSSVYGGLLFGASSYMVVWLAWPLSTVAAFVPFAFAGLEWYLARRRRAGLVLLGAGVAAMFFAGHIESTGLFVLALALFAAVRLLAADNRNWRTVGSLSVAALAGVLLAAVQLLPLAADLRSTTVLQDRATTTIGSEHLDPASLLSWVVPNGEGNPGLDQRPGRPPNYVESTGFIGLGALLLLPLGLVWLWRRSRATALGLGLLAAVSAAVAYGPLAQLMALMPGYSLARNTRLLGTLCLVGAVLAGCGLELLLERRPVPGRRVAVGGLLALGLLGTTGLATGAAFLAVDRASVDSLLPALGPEIGFWVAMAAAAAVSAVAYLGAAFLGARGSVAAAGLALVGLLEAAMFAPTFNPHVNRQDVDPRSQAIASLRSLAGDREVASTWFAMPPESAGAYGLHDVGAYDPLIDARQKEFWRVADPQGDSWTTNQDAIHDHVVLVAPDSRWLAAAGVAYVLTPDWQTIPGTRKLVSLEGTSIQMVQDARPFAFAATSTTAVRNATDAAAVLLPDPLATVAVEGGCCSGPSPAADVRVVGRGAGFVNLVVDGTAAATVVVLQSYASGWTAQLDGHPVQVQPADILFQAVRVPAGHHEVSLVYAPPEVEQGLLLSLTGLVLLILVATVSPVSRGARLLNPGGREKADGRTKQ